MPRGPARLAFARQPGLEDTGPEAVSGRGSLPGGVARERTEPVEVEEEQEAVGGVAPEVRAGARCAVPERALAAYGEEGALLVRRYCRPGLWRGLDAESRGLRNERRGARRVEAEREQPGRKQPARTMRELARPHVSQRIEVEPPRPLPWAAGRDGDGHLSDRRHLTDERI